MSGHWIQLPMNFKVKRSTQACFLILIDRAKNKIYHYISKSCGRVMKKTRWMSWIGDKNKRIGFWFESSPSLGYKTWTVPPGRGLRSTKCHSTLCCFAKLSLHEWFFICLLIAGILRISAIMLVGCVCHSVCLSVCLFVYRELFNLIRCMVWQPELLNFLISVLFFLNKAHLAVPG